VTLFILIEPLENNSIFLPLILEAVIDHPPIVPPLGPKLQLPPLILLPETVHPPILPPVALILSVTIVYLSI